MDIQKLLDIGFNIMPVNANKTPMGKWQQWQDKKIKNIESFEQSDFYALICGFNDVECIDIDTKVITDVVEKKEFGKNLFAMFNDNIDDFYNKVVVKQTRSGGYHILYKAKNIEGSKPILAKLRKYKQSAIETKGIGGYVCMYERVLRERDYADISLISNEDRDAIISCCQTFHEPEEVKPAEMPDKKTMQKFEGVEKTPWLDYNEKTNIWDLISNDFSITKKLSDKIQIRRNGSKNFVSGTIFLNTGYMYLFSPNTEFSAGEYITPFMVYAIQNFNGDFSKAGKDLYMKGFGSRHTPKLKKSIVNEAAKKIKNEKINFPIEILPAEIQAYIIESSKTLNMSVDYMGVSFLWSMSLIIGNAYVVEIKRGWTEICSLWLSIVGEAGVGKTPSLNQMTKPLFDLNSQKIKEYNENKKLFEAYEDLPKKEKQTSFEVEKPQRKQFIVDDVTIEALINLHSQSRNGVGVFKDELAGWFKDMNKYKEGSDKEQWLSSWSGKGIYVDRITRQSDYIKTPFMPVLGGIQPAILAGFFTDENKDNGFLDRMLFCFPDLFVERYTDSEMSYTLIEFYHNWMLSIQSEISKFTQYSEDGEIEPIIARFKPDTKKEWIKIFNEITDMQNSEKTPEFVKSMLAKQKSYIPRFALILNIINREKVEFGNEIELQSMQGAHKLSKYFIQNFEKLILINMEIADTSKIFKEAKGNKLDKLKAIFENNPDFNRSEVAKKLNISRVTLHKYLKELHC